MPSPCYPIHIWGPYFAGADVRQVPVGAGEDYFANVMEAWELGWPKPRVVVLSFPHNPTTACVELADIQRLVDWARERDVVLVHDFAYAEIAFDGWLPPSILQCEGAKECAVELYSMTKSFSMAGWRVAFLVGNRRGRAARWPSSRATSTTAPSSRSRSPRRSPSTRRQDFPTADQRHLPVAARHAVRRARPASAGRSTKPRGTMFAWAPIPEPYRELGSIEFAKLIVTDCDVAVSPGVGFGPGGDGHVRFALIENEQRIAQAVRNLKRGLTKLG